jgi:Peptidase family M28
MPGRRLAELRTGLVVTTLAWLAASCGEHRVTDAAVAAAETITAAAIRSHVATLADDSMRGRPTPSAALDLAAVYAVTTFRGAGLGPAFDSGFVQTWNTGTGTAPNVVGVLPGSDPALRSEYVLFVAHLDHIGTVADGLGCHADGADSLCNGADDNASGSAAVLELARVFGELSPAPRRSILFLLVSGEEEGLVGSSYYVAHPAVPLARTVAALNLDMISRNASDSLLVIGTELSSLGPLAAATAQAHPELHLRPAGVPWPYGGSDHIPFGSAGVPTLAFFTGLHADYHRASDETGRIDADKEARVVRLAFYLGLAIANADARPGWIAAVPARAGAGAGAPR